MSDESDLDYSERLKHTESDKGAVAKEKDPIKHFGNSKRSRATHKRKVTIYIKELNEIFKAGQLSTSLCRSQVKLIEGELKEIKGYDAIINEFLELVNFDETNPDLNDQELDGQAEYLIELTCELDPYYDYMVEQAPSEIDQSTKIL